MLRNPRSHQQTSPSILPLFLPNFLLQVFLVGSLEQVLHQDCQISDNINKEFEEIELIFLNLSLLQWWVNFAYCYWAFQIFFFSFQLLGAGFQVACLPWSTFSSRSDSCSYSQVWAHSSRLIELSQSFIYFLQDHIIFQLIVAFLGWKSLSDPKFELHLLTCRFPLQVESSPFSNISQPLPECFPMSDSDI